MESEYELERRKRIAENEKILKDLGLMEMTAIRAVGGTTAPKKRVPKKEKKPKVTPYTPPELVDTTKRRVTRSQTGKKDNVKSENEEIVATTHDDSSFIAPDENEEEVRAERDTIGNVFGAIPGIEVGRVWESRMGCSKDKIHRPPVAGIHGSEQDGCYSIAMSGTGEYNDDLDWGESFTYTGEGGRDLKGTKNNPKNLRTAAQSKDQTLTRGNLALSRNFYNRQPVRVVRGFKLTSSFAPVEGYRYDGLYTVEKFWETTGKSGYKVFKYALKRCPDQPVPWAVDSENVSVKDEEKSVKIEIKSE